MERKTMRIRTVLINAVIVAMMVAVVASRVPARAGALPVPEAVAEKRIALVVGNGDYREAGWSKLPVAVRDAKAMTALLRHLQFEVTEVVDADRETLRRAIADFGQKLDQTRRVGLFYYSGQAISAAGAELLMPIDAALVGESTMAKEMGISLDWVAAQMRSAERAILLVDACRSNPFDEGDRSPSVAVASLPKGAVVGRATLSGHVALGGPETVGNSVYTTALLQELPVPEREISEALRQVTMRVVAVTEGRQRPEFTYSLSRPFYPIPPAVGK